MPLQEPVTRARGLVSVMRCRYPASTPMMAGRSDSVGDGRRNPGDLLGQGLPRPGPLAAGLEQPEDPHARPGEGLDGVRRPPRAPVAPPGGPLVPPPRRTPRLKVRTLGPGHRGGQSTSVPGWATGT